MAVVAGIGAAHIGYHNLVFLAEGKQANHNGQNQHGAEHQEHNFKIAAADERRNGFMEHLYQERLYQIGGQQREKQAKGNHQKRQGINGKPFAFFKGVAQALGAVDDRDQLAKPLSPVKQGAGASEYQENNQPDAFGIHKSLERRPF